MVDLGGFVAYVWHQGAWHTVSGLVVAPAGIVDMLGDQPVSCSLVVLGLPEAPCLCLVGCVVIVRDLAPLVNHLCGGAC